jgi:hypothetical protein
VQTLTSKLRSAKRDLESEQERAESLRLEMDKMRSKMRTMASSAVASMVRWLSRHVDMAVETHFRAVE